MSSGKDGYEGDEDPELVEAYLSATRAQENSGEDTMSSRGFQPIRSQPIGLQYIPTGMIFYESEDQKDQYVLFQYPKNVVNQTDGRKIPLMSKLKPIGSGDGIIFMRLYSDHKIPKYEMYIANDVILTFVGLDEKERPCQLSYETFERNGSKDPVTFTGLIIRWSEDLGTYVIQEILKNSYAETVLGSRHQVGEWLEILEGRALFFNDELMICGEVDIMITENNMGKTAEYKLNSNNAEPNLIRNPQKIEAGATAGLVTPVKLEASVS